MCGRMKVKDKRNVGGHCELEKVHQLSSWKAERETEEKSGLGIGSQRRDALRTTANKLKMKDQQ